MEKEEGFNKAWNHSFALYKVYHFRLDFDLLTLYNTNCKPVFSQILKLFCCNDIGSNQHDSSLLIRGGLKYMLHKCVMRCVK